MCRNLHVKPVVLPSKINTATGMTLRIRRTWYCVKFENGDNLQETKLKKKRREMLAQRLKELRESRGWTQQDLAERSSISSRQIQRYESEENSPDANKLALLAKALEVSSDFLIGISSDPNGNISFKDLSHEEQRLVLARRNGKSREEKIKNILLAITSDEDLMAEPPK